MRPPVLFYLALLLVQFPEEKENRAVEMPGHNYSLIHRDVAILLHLPEPLRESSSQDLADTFHGG